MGDALSFQQDEKLHCLTLLYFPKGDATNNVDESPPEDNEEEVQLELTLAAESDEVRDEWVRGFQEFRNESKRKTRAERESRRLSMKDLKALTAPRTERL